MSMSEPTRCGCLTTCGDLPEREDDPRAVCKALPMSPKEPLVEIVTVPREGTATSEPDA